MGAVLALLGIATAGGLAYWLYSMGQSSDGGTPDVSAATDQPAPAPGMPAPSPGLQALAKGIARAEGFYVAGSLPNRSHNPGDLTKSFGFSVSGVANREGVLIFATTEDGWQALYKQLQLIYSGGSRSFSTGMSVADFAAQWTQGKKYADVQDTTEVDGWIASVLQEVNQGTGGSLDQDSALGEVSV
jgi:hypothetical protein